MGELASSSPRLYFVAAGMSLQKHPDSSLCLHPETWSLPSGSHFQTHQTPLTAWPGFFWRCCRTVLQIWASSPCLCLSFAAVQAVLHTPSLPVQGNDRPSGVTEYMEPNHPHSAHISLFADSLLPVASNYTRKKKMNIPKEGECTCCRIWEESEEENTVLYLPSNGTSFICNTTAAAFCLIRRFILPWTILGLC